MDIRRAEFDDCKDLTDMVGKNGGVSIFKATFGTYNLSSMIENSYLSLMATYKRPSSGEVEERDTISFFSLNDGLNLIANEPDAYTKIIQVLHHYIPATLSNVLFLNFWIVDECSKHYESACFEMIKKAFTTCSHIDFFIWVVPKNFFPSDYIMRLFSHLTFETAEGGSQESAGILDGYKVLFLHRSNYLPKLLVREARIEDNDDLIPILQNSNPDILVGQESYFLADLIQNQDAVNKFYVGLKKSSIVGMLATSLDVNVSLIQKVFDISPFPDLMIQKEERPLPPPLLISIVGDLRLIDVPTLQDAAIRNNCLFVNAETMKLALPMPVVAAPVASPPAAKGKGGESKKVEQKSEQKSEQKAEAKDEAPVDPNAPQVSPLKVFLDALLLKRTQDTSLPPPSAVVLFGYPRSENEAYERLQEMVYNFDYLIEVHNSAEEAEEDEDDDFLQHHLDALEVLREQYFSSEAKQGTLNQSQFAALAQSPTGQHKASWRKVTVASGAQPSPGSAMENDTGAEAFNKIDAVQNLTSDLSRIIDHRNLRIETQRIRDSEEPPKANAFAVTVFSLEEDFLSRGEDLVKIAFEDHPRHDYCLYMVSNDHPPPPALVRCLTYVKPLPGVSFNQSLYLMHRSAFLVNDYMQVVRLDHAALPSLEQFAQSLPQLEMVSLVDGARNALLNTDVDLRDNPAEVCFTVKIGNTIVGVVTLSRKLNSNEDASWFRANYHVDELINFERHRVRNQAVITKWMLDPVYSPFTRRVLQEVMRMYGKTMLYYQTERDVCPPKNILEEFISLKPRRRMQAGGSVKVELVDRPSAAIGGLGNDCPLYCISKHYLSNPKDIVARRVVVVGGSSHSYALLNTLCAVPYLTFPNIFLVLEKAPRAISLASSSSEEFKFEDDCSGCLSITNEHYPIEQELFALGLGHKVHLIYGHLTDIDRENKAIVVSGELALEYDILVLSTCAQDGSTKLLPSLGRLHPAKCADIGVFSLGNPAADLHAMRYIRQRYANRSDDVVVSGSGLPVFAAVARLLKIGVAPTRITVVVREDEGHVEGLTEKTILEPMLKGILSVGIKMCWGFGVADVYMTHTGFLGSVELRRSSELAARAQPHPAGSAAGDSSHHEYKESSEGGVMLACMALLCCTNSVCDRDVFSAVVDSGLVFDGGLVVDTSFRTVDTSIYAMSDYTRFSRVYKDAHPHSSFNPEEVGSFVALKILEQQLDPTLSRPHQYADISASSSAIVQAHKPVNRSTRPALPQFLLPRSMSCDLPGNLNYFCSRLPVVPAEAVSYLTDATAIPGDVRSIPKNRFCVLKTSFLGTVVEIMYLGEDIVENRNLALLPGIHEAYLNSAVFTHGKGYVTDWVEYFRQEWAGVIFQDKFPVLVQALRRSLATDKGMLMILNRVFERAENCQDGQDLADTRREFLGAHGELAPDSTLRTIETETIEFLKENRALLPRFHIPTK